MNKIATQSLAFEGQQISALNYQDRIWLTAAEIAKALQYAREDAVSRIYQRNTDEFSAEMTLNVNLTVKGFGNGNSEKTVRIFSLRGAHLIAMLARTPVAKKFRKWVLDVLEKETQPTASESRTSNINDRTVLNLAVKTLADLRAQSGKPADTASVWRMVDGHLGIQSIEHASLAEVNEALVFVHQQLHNLVYEGEWLPRPATPAASPVKINYPVQRWFDENPWFKKYQPMNKPGHISITATMLYGMDAKSPTLMLAHQLTQEGHNLEACKLEVLALRHHLENARNALGDIQRRCNNNLTGQWVSLSL